MQKCHLDRKLEIELGYSFYRIANDVNGNPRYVVHYLAFDNDYETARKKAKSVGFSVYRGKNFGGGFVTQSYNLESDAEAIIRLRGNKQC